MEIKEKISALGDVFAIAGECVAVSVIKSGHINATYKAVFRQKNRKTIICKGRKQP